jgi:ankyrin repeat domain-containing protein 50
LPPQKIVNIDLVRRRFLQTAINPLMLGSFLNNMKGFSKLKDSLLGGAKKKADGGSEGGSGVSSPSANSAADFTSTPTASAPASGPAKGPPTMPVIAQSPAEHIVSSVLKPLKPTATSPAPAPSAQFAASDATSSAPSHYLNPWTRAYGIFQSREPELMADYKTHLASLQDDAAASGDLSTPRSVECIVKQLLEAREKKQWRVPLLQKDVKVRDQAERLAKFLLWSDPIVKNAVSAQPYAALAWSGVSLLLPVGT